LAGTQASSELSDGSNRMPLFPNLFYQPRAPPDLEYFFLGSALTANELFLQSTIVARSGCQAVSLDLDDPRLQAARRPSLITTGLLHVL